MTRTEVARLILSRALCNCTKCEQCAMYETDFGTSTTGCLLKKMAGEQMNE